MKTKEFLDILNHLKFIFVVNNYSKDANYVFFNTIENIIYSYSDYITYIHHYAGNLKEDFELESTQVAIPAKKLHAVISKIKAEDIRIYEKDDTFVIKNGRASNKISIPMLIPDKAKLELEPMGTGNLPPTLPTLFKTHCIFDKTKEKVRNVIFEDGYMISSDRYNIIKVEIPEWNNKKFVIGADILTHIIAKQFDSYGVSGSTVRFKKDGYTLITENREDEIFPYGSFFNNEELYFDYSIHMNKEQDIGYVDSFLLNFKKPDKKIKVHVISDSKIILIAEGDDKTEETRIPIKIDKYNAGEEDIFLINPDYFKSIYADYDYFYILDRMLFAVNVEDRVERITGIKNITK